MTSATPTKLATLSAVIAIATAAHLAIAQGEESHEQPLSKTEFAEFLKEYEQFKSEYGRISEENQRLKSDLTTLQKQFAELSDAYTRTAVEQNMARERAEVLNIIQERVEQRNQPLLPGFSNFVLSGTAVTSFQNREEVDSTFGAGFAPLFLWQPTDRLLFETQVGFGLTRDDTNVELEYAQLSFLVNDYITLGAGKFLLPFATFWERWHPAWVNKLPTMPLLYQEGLVGQTGLGLQIRGGAPIGPTKINYAAYVINGPDFNSNLVSAGQLGFNNFRDNNNNKSVGGRVGFLPIPELELGYSILAGRVGDSGSRYSGADTLMQAIDFSYAREFEAIKGRLDLRAEAIWVNTDDVIFTGPFDPFTFHNKRNGWFIQAAYRPTLADLTLGDRIELRNFEFVARYDQVYQSGPGNLGVDRDQLTLGLDYWIEPNVAIKVAFVLDDAHGEDDQNGFFIQMAVGL